MPTDVLSEQPSVDVCRHLRRWAHAEFAEQAIQTRHPGIAADRRRRKARDAAASIIQSLEFLESGRAATLLTRPLLLFYAAEAIAKAVAIVIDPSLDGSSFKAHGLKGVKDRRYFIRTLACDFWPPGQDVWSRVCTTANADIVRIARIIDGSSMNTDLMLDHTSAPWQQLVRVELGELLRQIPELSEDLRAAGMKHPWVVHVSDYRAELWSPSNEAQMRILLRHAHDADTRAMILREDRPTGELKCFHQTLDTLDVLEYTADRQVNLLTPEWRCDVFGRLYANFVPQKYRLGELPIYYLSLFILSDAVRYQSQWSRLIDDRPHEAVLIERFLDVAARKLPNLALNHLTDGFYRFTMAADET